MPNRGDSTLSLHLECAAGGAASPITSHCGRSVGGREAFRVFLHWRIGCLVAIFAQRSFLPMIVIDVSASSPPTRQHFALLTAYCGVSESNASQPLKDES